MHIIIDGESNLFSSCTIRGGPISNMEFFEGNFECQNRTVHDVIQEVI